ncbi:MAG TPA: radical SAM protein, partial [Nitrospirota bacterium]|nr:radical SAM protein [Nitrospirota bacterium]
MEVSTLQVNVGYRCNLTCKHCHVEGSPARTEMMDKETIDSVLAVLAEQPIRVIDITGGAPELNPHFRYLVTEARRLKKHIIARTNLVIFYEQGLEDFPEFYHNNCV